MGANAATKFTFSTTVSLSGNLLKKGNYTMLVKLGQNQWEFFIYPYESTRWTEYLDKTPMATFISSVEKMNNVKESFEISIQDLMSQTASLEFNWEYYRVKVPIAVETIETVLSSIEKTMKGPTETDYFRAALFLHENKIDLPRALRYIKKTTSGDALFFRVYREALILKDLDKDEEALEAAQRSLTLSRKAQNDDFIRLNEQLIEQLK